MISPLISLMNAANNAVESWGSAVTLETVVSLQNMIDLALDLPGSLVKRAEGSTSNWGLCCAFIGCWLARLVLVRTVEKSTFTVANE